MLPSSDMPWVKINEFLLDIGKVREPKEFCVQTTPTVLREASTAWTVPLEVVIPIGK